MIFLLHPPDKKHHDGSSVYSQGQHDAWHIVPDIFLQYGWIGIRMDDWMDRHRLSDGWKNGWMGGVRGWMGGGQVGGGMGAGGWGMGDGWMGVQLGEGMDRWRGGWVQG